MKIYFSASLSGKKLYLSNYQVIVDKLTGMGHEVFSDYFFKPEIEDVQNQTLEEHVAIHKNMAKMKIQSDLIVAELSFRSFAQGQEISSAFRIGKPVLGIYLYGKKPHLILNDAGDRLLLLEYNLTNFTDVLKQGIEYLVRGSNKRFTMILPSQIVDYLDIISRDDNVSRSEYIRSLIEKDMESKK